MERINTQLYNDLLAKSSLIGDIGLLQEHPHCKEQNNQKSLNEGRVNILQFYSFHLSDTLKLWMVSIILKNVMLI